MQGITATLKHNSPRSRAILESVRQRVLASRSAYSKRHTQWRKNEDAALAYIHESELDRIRKSERDYGGKPALTTLRIPYSYGVLMASHTYWTTVFLSRVPIMQFSGRHGESEQQVQALEALVDYQMQVGEMLVPLYLWLLDPGKYGLGVLGINWSDEFSVVSQIQEQPETFLGLNTGRTKKLKIPRRIPGYSGNRLLNIRPFDFFPDPRIPVRFFQKGEYCAVRVDVGWNQIIKRTAQGYYNPEIIEMLKMRQENKHSGSSRIEGSPNMDLPPTTDEQYGYDEGQTAKKRARNATVSLYECHIELIPADWRLGAGQYPEKWVFTVNEDFTHLLGAQPLGANHDKFPFSVLEYEPEGYSIASRGISEILGPVNDAMDWLINSHLFNVRKALNDQFVVDPSAIEVSDLETPLPGGAIRLAPGAYGGDVKKAIMQLPVQDVTRTHLTDMSALLSIGQRAIGVNDQLMGQINPQGRRSATEVRQGAGFGINRLKTISEFFSVMGFVPMAQQIVQNSQQHYDAIKKFKVVGNLAAEAGQEFIDVTPESILGFYDFVPVDGTQPVDRLAQVTMWTNLFGQMASIPQILMQYDIGRIFEWVAQLGGLKNVSQFRIQMTPEEELIKQAIAGNMASLGGSGEPNAVGMPAPQSGPPGVGTASGGPSNSGPPPLQVVGGGPSPAAQGMMAGG